MIGTVHAGIASARSLKVMVGFGGAEVALACAVIVKQRGQLRPPLHWRQQPRAGRGIPARRRCSACSAPSRRPAAPGWTGLPGPADREPGWRGSRPWPPLRRRWRPGVVRSLSTAPAWAVLDADVGGHLGHYRPRSAAGMTVTPFLRRASDDDHRRVVTCSPSVAAGIVDQIDVRRPC